MKSSDLKLLIAEGEGLTVEFKAKYTSKIDRDIVAFSNTKGGHILLGVDDTGKIQGEKLTSQMKAEITDLARKCEPPITVKTMSQIGKVVAIEIEEGHEKPYSSSDGYFRRLDAVTQKMNRKEIEVLFKQAFKVSFEEQIYSDITWKDIDKAKIRRFFDEADIRVRSVDVRNVLASLKLSDGKHIKNAGVLFFAKDPRNYILQCETICVAFKGTNRVHIYDRSDIQEDLLTQFNESVKFLKKHLNVRSKIKGVKREDIYEIPIEALREALANAIIHRDYGMRGTSIMVEVHEDRVEIKNPGGLAEGLTPQSLMNISVRRNELIADIFARMDVVERIGSGMQRMHNFMKEAELPPPKIQSDTFFVITFERPPYSLSVRGLKKGVEKVGERVGVKVGERVTENQKKILGEIRRNVYISAKELAQLIGISPRKTEENLRKLKGKGLLRRVGPDKGGHWEVLK